MRELKSCGAQLILLLSHCGLRDDLKFAAENPGLIDVIVGGHSHSELHEIRRVGDTIIVQAGMLGKFVGELEIELEFDHDHDNRQSDEHCNEYSDMQKQRIVNVNRYCLHDTSNLDDIDGAATATLPQPPPPPSPQLIKIKMIRRGGGLFWKSTAPPSKASLMKSYALSRKTFLMTP